MRTSGGQDGIPDLSLKLLGDHLRCITPRTANDRDVSCRRAYVGIADIYTVSGESLPIVATTLKSCNV